MQGICPMRWDSGRDFRIKKIRSLREEGKGISRMSVSVSDN